MRVFHSERHRAHFPQAELHGGRSVTPFERPNRVEYILSRLRERGMEDIVAPDAPDLDAIRAMCDAGYLEFLQNAWDEWVAEGFSGEIIAASFPARRMQTARSPRNIDGKVGYYALASETAMTRGTWEAATRSAACAQTAAARVSGGANKVAILDIDSTTATERRTSSLAGVMSSSRRSTARPKMLPLLPGSCRRDRHRRWRRRHGELSRAACHRP